MPFPWEMALPAIMVVGESATFSSSAAACDLGSRFKRAVAGCAYNSLHHSSWLSDADSPYLSTGSFHLHW